MQLLGGGWAVNDYDDLELAARIPGASSITDCESPIGGKMVTLEDPTGGQVYVHWGHKQRSKGQVRIPKAPAFNKGVKEPRLDECQYLNVGSSRIHKIGHYGYEVSHSDFEAVRNWYFERLTLAPTDSLFNTKTGKDVMTFAHVDRGEKYVDHHVSRIQSVQNAVLPGILSNRAFTSQQATWKVVMSLITPALKWITSRSIPALIVQSRSTLV